MNYKLESMKRTDQVSYSDDEGQRQRKSLRHADEQGLRQWLDSLPHSTTIERRKAMNREEMDALDHYLTTPPEEFYAEEYQEDEEYYENK